MSNLDWAEEFPGGIAVCDTQGIILALNHYDAQVYEDRGGKALIGTNLYECHSQHSEDMIREMMAKDHGNIYIVEKNGQRELVIQSPWYQGGKLAGLVEITVEIEGEIPVIVR